MSAPESHADPVPAPTWLLRTLGQAEVLVNGAAVVWTARSAAELLWYLHAHPDGRYRHDLLRDLWDLEDTPAALNRFRVTLHRLRHALGRADAVTESGGRYALHPDLLAASDTATLHDALRGARQAGPRVSARNCCAAPWPARTASTCRT
ncbi:hypothetical protein ACFQDE_06290 [Deinococcus caeni]|uniref:hypothetical protein n=1 Tax=Deinococcus caeni TaxID=569127 RepID=UPI00360F8214